MRVFELLMENYINVDLKNTNYTYDDLVELDWEDLCMMAYGVKNDEIIELKPSEIKIKYKGDLVNPKYKFEKGGMAWCRSVSFDEPLHVSLGLDGKDTNEIWYLEDGHHRLFCAKKLKMPYVKCFVEVINLKAINKILKMQEDFKK